MTRIGLISDTHGLLREEALAAFKGVDRIIHAGDIGSEGIIPKLEALAPVTAVRGNVDSAPWAQTYPLNDMIQVEDCFIYVHHGHHPLSLDPVAAKLQVILSGHTHQPVIEKQAGIVYLNPGSAGPKRFSYPISLALMTVSGSELEAELIDLERLP